MFKVYGIILAAVGIVLLVIWLAFAALVRRIQLTKWSRRAGLRYQGHPADTFHERLWGPPLNGAGATASDIITGTVAGRPLLCFSYSYLPTPAPAQQQQQVVASGAPPVAGQAPKPPTRSECSFYAISLPRSLPRLQVQRRERDSALRLPGLTCVPTGDQRFDAVFEVATEDIRLAQDVLNGPMRDWLLAKDASGFRVVGSDVVLADMAAISPKKIDAQLAQLTGIVQLLPASVCG